MNITPQEEAQRRAREKEELLRQRHVDIIQETWRELFCWTSSI